MLLQTFVKESGGIKSGSPIPKLITSRPAACFAAIFLSRSANRYSGKRVSRCAGADNVLFSIFNSMFLHYRSAQLAGQNPPKSSDHDQRFVILNVVKDLEAIPIM
jgi:hypothetical protein